jgi:hypothetical protein
MDACAAATSEQTAELDEDQRSEDVPVVLLLVRACGGAEPSTHRFEPRQSAPTERIRQATRRPPRSLSRRLTAATPHARLAPDDAVGAGHALVRLGLIVVGRL